MVPSGPFWPPMMQIGDVRERIPDHVCRSQESAGSAEGRFFASVMCNLQPPGLDCRARNGGTLPNGQENPNRGRAPR